MFESDLQNVRVWRTTISFSLRCPVVPPFFISPFSTNKFSFLFIYWFLFWCWYGFVWSKVKLNGLSKKSSYYYIFSKLREEDDLMHILELNHQQIQICFLHSMLSALIDSINYNSKNQELKKPTLLQDFLPDEDNMKWMFND